MTTTNDTTTAAEKLQELNAKIDAAMIGKGPYTSAELQEESLAFCRLQGGEAGDLSRRLRELKEKEEEEGATVQLMDAMNWAGDLINGAINMLVDEHMPPVAAALWQSGAEALDEPRYSVAVRVSQMTRLKAFLMAPDALTQVVRDLRTTLVDADPQLAPLAGDVVPVGDLAVPRSHTIDGTIFELAADGAITICARDDNGTIIRMTCREAFSLLTFIRIPGVATLIEDVDARRQLKSWHDFENDPETIAERAASAR